ncbi:hypothetical protein ACHAW6_011560 [Cyclotella cf. meneghiniana]
MTSESIPPNNEPADPPPPPPTSPPPPPPPPPTNNRTVLHTALRAYELKRRTAYSSKLSSSSLYWRAFRTLLHDALDETSKAEFLLKGWTNVTEMYGKGMRSLSEFCIEKNGTVVTDEKRRRRMIEENAAAAAAAKDAGSSVGDEKCGAMVQRLADSAGSVGGQYEEMVEFMKKEVLPQLSELCDSLKSELTIMEKLGDSIMQELEAAEQEVCLSWDSYYNKSVEYNTASSETLKARNRGAQIGTSAPDPNSAIECADVWIDEMRYRMAVAFLSSAWEKCSAELSKLFSAMKNAECDRRNRIKELLIKATQRQERLWLGLPSTIQPVLKELIGWPMEKKMVEEDVQSSIRARAQFILKEETEHKKAADSKPNKANGLTGVDQNAGNFELSSPLVSDLMCKAKVIEKRSGLMSTWKVTLGIITADNFLQLFELPSNTKMQPGSAPEVAFQNLIPPVLVPTLEIMRAGGGGVKFPSTKHWFDNLVPSESIALPNSTVSFKDDKTPTFEIAETVLTSGASKMFTKTLNRKVLLRAITRQEAEDFVNALKGGNGDGGA